LNQEISGPLLEFGGRSDFSGILFQVIKLPDRFAGPEQTRGDAGKENQHDYRWQFHDWNCDLETEWQLAASHLFRGLRKIIPHERSFIQHPETLFRSRPSTLNPQLFSIWSCQN
jgi:hypothetical protein